MKYYVTICNIIKKNEPSYKVEFEILKISENYETCMERFYKFLDNLVDINEIELKCNFKKIEEDNTDNHSKIIKSGTIKLPKKTINFNIYLINDEDDVYYSPEIEKLIIEYDREMKKGDYLGVLSNTTFNSVKRILIKNFYYKTLKSAKLAINKFKEIYDLEDEEREFDSIENHSENINTIEVLTNFRTNNVWTFELLELKH